MTPFPAIFVRMGNEMADAIRDELRDELISAYGSLEAAAEAVGIPYKTLYRALTTRGKDRSQSVKLELVIEIADHLAARGYSSFSTIYARAGARKDEYDLVANDSIDESFDVPDSDFDNA